MSSDVIEQLRKTIEAAPVSRYRLSQLTGVDQASISRFMHGRPGLGLQSFAKLCDVLDLELRSRKDDDNER